MKKDANLIKERVKEKVASCDILLWGYGKLAKNFYDKYKDKLHLKVCITDDRIHPDFFDEENTIPIIEWKDYKGELNEYIIVCELPFNHIENEILASGLHFFEDYIGVHLLEVILSDKKIAIVAGNCQMAMIFDFLQASKRFTEQYQIFRFASHYWKSRWSLRGLSFLRNLCELYICIKHEDEDKRFYNREELPENCKVVTVTTAILRLYWPQLKVNLNARNEYFISNKEGKGHSPFECADTNINKMIAEGKRC